MLLKTLILVILSSVCYKANTTREYNPQRNIQEIILQPYEEKGKIVSPQEQWESKKLVLNYFESNYGGKAKIYT